LGYCTVADVKQVLQFAETGWDFEIEDILPTSDALVDAAPAKELLTVSTPVPEFVKAAAKYFATWAFRRRALEPGRLDLGEG
jgi:hypothetical protein